jgi:hypothetical protein
MSTCDVVWGKSSHRPNNPYHRGYLNSELPRKPVRDERGYECTEEGSSWHRAGDSSLAVPALDPEVGCICICSKHAGHGRLFEAEQPTT